MVLKEKAPGRVRDMSLSQERGGGHMNSGRQARFLLVVSCAWSVPSLPTKLLSGHDGMWRFPRGFLLSAPWKLFNLSGLKYRKTKRVIYRTLG